jgi:hypothetical protein
MTTNADIDNPNKMAGFNVKMGTFGGRGHSRVGNNPVRSIDQPTHVTLRQPSATET